jgi:NAD(P)-dependent dehydrogenase (short-subunit alcohol dehydrogenase family)
MWTENDLGDQSGKYFIVTGGNTGLRFMTARYLLQAGARVLITARDPGRGRKGGPIVSATVRVYAY